VKNEIERKYKTKIRVNCTLYGEPAKILIELKQRGLATSNTDAVIQALYALHEKIVNRDIRLAQLKTLTEAQE
jgi:hypothetical protein